MTNLLEAERAQASFDVRQLTFLLDGGQKRTEERERVEVLVEADPVFANADLYALNRTDRYRRAMQKQRRVIELSRELGIPEFQLRRAVHDDLGTDLQGLMFIPNIRATFSEEQQAHWLPRAESWEVIGCYAQTELGHGSNIRGLETLATYIAETDEIEIHSPTTTSTKWWPGALGKTANHAIVYARLIVGGQDLGVHNFMVQIRDITTHLPCNGVVVGDIGPKIGYNNQDNGFLRFDRVRIPRTQMAMRHVTLLNGGHYEAAPKRQAASYSSMTFVRSQIVMGSGHMMSRACTIAVRYSAVRHQGMSALNDGSETKILDYTMQQQRLLPLVATSYAFYFAGVAMQRLLSSEDAEAIHVSSSGMKALCSRITSDGIEVCRRACGGHGYLQASGLPELLGGYLQNVTVEGENFMIAQQTTRGLLKILNNADAFLLRARAEDTVLSAMPATGANQAASAGSETAYLQEVTTALRLRCTAHSVSDFFSSDLQRDAYRQRAAWLITDLKRKLDDATMNGLTYQDAWNAVCPDVIRVSEAHCFYVIVSNFCAAIEQLQTQQPNLAPVLQNCCHLFSLWWMQENMGEFLEAGFLDPLQAGLLRQAVRDLLPVLRADAVPLVDAWGHSDHALNSALGRWDGQVYDALLASAQPELNPMNRDLITPAFEESIKPMRFSKL
jgi:acyl-CoA oxidase